MEIRLTPIASVQNTRKEPVDDFWGSVVSEIILDDRIPQEAITGIEQFSHLEIIYFFHWVPSTSVTMSGHPRGNPGWPTMGIFAQRKKDRPNRLGLCTVELLSHTVRTLTVRGLDAIDGTPVLDIKPVFLEFLPKGNIRQPHWVSSLMKDYWR